MQRTKTREGIETSGQHGQQTIAHGNEDLAAEMKTSAPVGKTDRGRKKEKSTGRAGWHARAASESSGTPGAQNRDSG
jgi:hypothetical protein